MERERIDQALARLEAALARAQAAAPALAEKPAVDPAAFAGLEQRHHALKSSVQASLRQLDEILAGMPQ